MKIYKYPEQKDWQSLLQRPVMDTEVLNDKVKEVLAAVKNNGDLALKKFTEQFDGVVVDNFLVSDEEIAAAINDVSDALKSAIQVAVSNVTKFHQAQLSEPTIVETMPGVQCWRKAIGIEKVGIYIPGGTAPLFSTVLMLAIPASLAGCKEIVLCTPPDKSGNIHPAILYAANITGIQKIFKVGGAQAIAAMAFGTSSIPKVNKIFGPGNQYVTAAKQLVQEQGIAIDMPAGPSEVCVLADETGNATFIAADLLSQAEHGVDSQVLFVSTSQILIENVLQEITLQLNQLPRKAIAEKALLNSKAILVQDINIAIDIVNEYAAEHLIVQCIDAADIANKIINAGSVFIGNYSPESVGDYASGTNHTLPTNGYAKAYSGVSVDSFTKKITFQQLTQNGLTNIGPAVIEMANAEGLDAHAAAVMVRLKH